ncbi:hypothetical protein GCM10007875_21570 [Limnobacter litoralis]|uniref:Uncharacterized protein n=1 Tax=Limnobacter litoralis TaxID=481366 RepID=A0ABQ5YUC9_9BURK|nr:hypothetical protein GCM10007875_21570 [Limnobacter litoralis]
MQPGTRLKAARRKLLLDSRRCIKHLPGLRQKQATVVIDLKPFAKPIEKSCIKH